MQYGRTLRIFLWALPALSICRIIQKAIFIDPATGFCEGNALLTYIFYFGLVYAAAAIFFAALGAARGKTQTLKANRFTEFSVAALGASLVAAGFVRLFDIQIRVGMQNPFVLLPPWLDRLEQLLGIAAGISLILTALIIWSGSRAGQTARILALVPAIWQTFLLVERFITFRQVLTVSDQLLETLFLASACFFFVNYAGCIIFKGSVDARLVSSALWSCLLGIVMTAGRYAAMPITGFVGRGEQALLLTFVAISIFSFLFILPTMIAPAETKPVRQVDLEDEI